MIDLRSLRIGLVLLVLLPICSVFGYSNLESRATLQPTGGGGLPRIRIGRTISKSGVYAEESQAVIDGIHFWFELLNNQTGGVINTTQGLRAIELIEYNDASDEENVKLFYRDMAEFDNITAAFGPWTTQLTIPAIQQTSNYQIPFVFSGASAPIFYNASRYTHSFGLLVQSGKRSLPCVQLFGEERVQTAAIIASDDPFQQTVLGLLRLQLQAENITLVYNVTVKKEGSDNYAPIVDRIGDENPDVVLCAQETPNFKPFIQMLRQRLPEDIPRAVYNSNAATASFVYNEVGWSADLVYGGDQWSPLLQFNDSFFGSTAGFAEKYKARFNHTPGFVDAASVMAGFVMQNALETAASFSTADIVAALRAFRLPSSFFGPISFLATGELNNTGICTQLLPPTVNETTKSTKVRQLFPVAPSEIAIRENIYPAFPIRPPGPNLSSSQVKLVIALSVVGGVLLIGAIIAVAFYFFRRKFEVVLFPKTTGEDRW